MPTTKSEDTDDIQSLPAGVRIISLVAGVILMVLGWKQLVSDYHLLHKLTHLSEEYRAVPAKILEVNVSRDTARTVDKYHPYIRFEYFVDGQSVWGWHFSYEDEPRTRLYWEKRLSQYHPSDRITAYVNPEDGKDSFVEKKTDSLIAPGLKFLLALAFVIFGLFLFAIPVIAFFGMLFRSKKP